MLADLKVVNCYDANFPNRDENLLKSAKQNLKEMAFFGLHTYWTESLYLFEKTFNVRLGQDLEMDDGILPNLGSIAYRTLSSQQQEAIIEANRLDIELYQYATRLFVHQFEAAKNSLH